MNKQNFKKIVVLKNQIRKDPIEEEKDKKKKKKIVKIKNKMHFDKKL